MTRAMQSLHGAAVLSLLLLSSCGGGSPASAVDVGPYPGDSSPGVPGPTSPTDVTTPDDPGLVSAVQVSTPNDRYGVVNLTGVPLDRVGFSREGEYLPELGYLADHGDFLFVPWVDIAPGVPWEVPAYAHRPLDGVPHVALARDVLGRRYEALYVPRPGARGWIVTPEMVVTP